MIRITAVYANLPGSRFDSQYYLQKHAPMAESLLRPHGLQAVRLTVGITGLAGEPPPFWAVSEMLFESRAAFDAAMGRCAQKLMGDTPNYTDVTPLLQVSALAADSRDAQDRAGES